MSGRLADKVALIFGASPHIGGTIGHFMAKEGARVAFCDRLADAAEAATSYLAARGHAALALTGDAAEEAGAGVAVAATVAHFGGVDVMVNLSGSQTRFEVRNFAIEDWDRQMRLYAGAAALTTKHAAAAMIARGKGGAIIHVASDAARQGEAGNSGYSAAKAAVVNFARAAAAELGSHAIRVNTISPTYMENNLWKYGHAPPSSALQASAQDFLRGIPLQRFCRPGDVAAAAVFLASDEASFITGVDLALDGGAGAKYWPWQPNSELATDLEGYVRRARRKAYGDDVE